jgi:hypothetical protein
VSFPSLFKAGDLLVLALMGLVTAGLFLNAWSKPQGNALVVRSQGKVMVRASLDQDADYAVPGMLGLSKIEVRHGRARVAADPGLKQICVKQGWVSRAGEMALCLANQVSVEVSGAGKPFDSVSY